MAEQKQASRELPWTGERLVTGIKGTVAIEHLHRYSVAAVLARGKDVVDIASGEGYGSNQLAAEARHVTGVDVCPDAVRHAHNKYSRPNLTFKVGDCAAIPLANASVDLVVSFETLEHHDKHQEMMAEVKRVLRPEGVLILSTPNKRVYTDLPRYNNPFHVKELYRDEFEALLGRHFKLHLLLGQMPCDGSLIVPMGDAGESTIEVLEGDFEGADRNAWFDRTIYFMAIASDAPCLPAVPVGVFDGRRLWPTREQYTAELEAARAELAAIRSSRSWRLARVFSRMAGVAKKWKRRVGALGNKPA